MIKGSIVSEITYKKLLYFKQLTKLKSMEKTFLIPTQNLARTLQESCKKNLVNQEKLFEYF